MKPLAIDSFWPTVATFNDTSIYIQTYRFERTIHVQDISHSFAGVSQPTRIAIKELEDLTNRLNSFQAFLYDLSNDGRLPPEIDRRYEIHQFTDEQLYRSYKYWRSHARFTIIANFTDHAVAVRNQRRQDVLFQRRLSLLAHLKSAQADLSARAYPLAPIQIVGSRDPAAFSSSDTNKARAQSASVFAAIRRAFAPAYPRST